MPASSAANSGTFTVTINETSRLTMRHRVALMG